MPAMTNQTAIIIGAGPVGLKTAYEQVKRTNIKPKDNIWAVNAEDEYHEEK